MFTQLVIEGDDIGIKWPFKWNHSTTHTAIQIDRQAGRLDGGLGIGGQSE